LQFIIVAAFGALCFGCGYLVAFIVTRNKWRDEMIKRGAASADRQMGMARAAKETEGVGSAMIQSAADCGQHTNLPDLL
jgi:hypothetical protein